VLLRRSQVLGILIVLLLLTLSCKSDQRLIGKYQADISAKGESQFIFLELMANGRGLLSSEEDNVSFKWESREGVIWLHTSSGGIIVAKDLGETIEIDVPDSGGYSFVRFREDWEKNQPCLCGCPPSCKQCSDNNTPCCADFKAPSHEGIKE
jgi:hypothetical protein